MRAASINQVKNKDKEKMSKKLTVMELPICREYFGVFKEILEKLENLIQNNSKHSLLIRETYKTTIQIFPYLTAGYNHFGVKGKVKLYNKVRLSLSQLQSQLHILHELKLFEKDYFEDIESSIKYIGGLIKKIEGLPNEK